MAVRLHRSCAAPSSVSTKLLSASGRLDVTRNSLTTDVFFDYISKIMISLERVNKLRIVPVHIQ